MIEGITVLNTVAIYNNPVCVLIAILLLGLAVICAITACAMKSTNFVALALVFLLGWLCMMIISEFYTPNLDYYKYKVTIDDTLSMTEFNSRYEIISQEGKIYTIIEKEN